MAEQSTFNFDEHGICKPDADGRYRGNFFYIHPDEDGISEAEAIRQWLCSVTIPSEKWPYIDRLVELADK